MIMPHQATYIGNRTHAIKIGLRIVDAERLAVDVTYKVDQHDRLVDANKKIVFHNIQLTIFNETINYRRDIFAATLLKSGIASGCQFVVGREIFHIFEKPKGIKKPVGKALNYACKNLKLGLVRRVGKEAALGIKNNIQMKIEDAIAPLLFIFYCNSISLKKRGDGRK